MSQAAHPSRWPGKAPALQVPKVIGLSWLELVFGSASMRANASLSHHALNLTRGLPRCVAQVCCWDSICIAVVVSSCCAFSTCCMHAPHHPPPPTTPIATPINPPHTHPHQTSCPSTRRTCSRALLRSRATTWSRGEWAVGAGRGALEPWGHGNGNGMAMAMAWEQCVVRLSRGGHGNASQGGPSPGGCAHTHPTTTGACEQLRLRSLYIL